MTPDTQKILVNCWKCGQMMWLEAALDCPPETIDSLARMTTCDRCAGPERRRQPKRDAGYRQPHND